MPTRVAIACQGGGSHTAFTAGVLDRLCANVLDTHEVVGLSGTSGGAVCALLTWAALRDGDPVAARRSLDAFWADNSATSPCDQLLNQWLMLAADLQQFVVMPAVNPYTNVLASSAAEDLKAMLRRRVDFDRIQPGSQEPVLVIGAVNVLSGEFRAFDSRKDRISADTILASAAIPTLFRAVTVEGETFWDGLFSQNPPIRELVDLKPDKPDEIWVIQIDRTRCDSEPHSVLEITDRRTELAGNLSLYQELRFVEKINQWLDDGVINPNAGYKHIVVRILELSPSGIGWPLTARSALNRDPAFIRDLIAHGRKQAHEFLAALAFEHAWIDEDWERVVGLFAEDVELTACKPFPEIKPTRGRDEVRPFVGELLSQPFTDPSRKQVVGDRVAWTVKTSPPGAVVERGQAEIILAGGRITSLRFGPSN